MRVAVVSLNQIWMKKDDNILRCASFVSQAKEKGCEVVFFPEMTLTGYSLDVQGVAESLNSSKTMEGFSVLAMQYRVTIVFGACLFEGASLKPKNHICLATMEGQVRSIYAKIHPFSFVEEGKYLEAGDSLGVASMGDLVLGCAICYDLRFPELFSILSRQCNLVCVIANWPAARTEHWKALLLARAIENQYFVVGVNRVGVDGNGLTYVKSSAVFSPDGQIVEPLYETDELAVFDMDLSEVTRSRDSFPTFKDKRFELYRKLLENV